MARAQITFSFTYQDAGTGFNDPTTGAARRAALEDAASTLAGFLPISTAVTVTFAVASTNENTSTLASAGSDSTGTVSGFSPTIVQQKITTGTDSNGSTADGTINWNFSHNWDLDNSIATDAFDFKSTAMHEVLHAMGFTSAIGKTGDGLFVSPVGQPNGWYTFDKYVVDAAGNHLVGTDFSFNSSLISALTGGSSLYFNGPKATAANGGKAVVLYSPTSWDDGSSGSHTDDTTYTGTLALLMNSATAEGPGVRVLSAVEKGMLEDLGYAFDTPTTPAQFSYLSNLSVRSGAGTGAQTLIVGFVTRNGDKSLLIRGVGPTLGGFGVANALADPQLKVSSAAGVELVSNDDWVASSASVFVQAGAFALPAGSLDAAVTANPTAGGYSAQVSGANGETGVALVELYDLVAPTNSSGAKLVNVSARTQVGTGGDILIAGFAIGGTGPRTLLIRVIGPTLSGFGVAGALADPKMELYTGSTKLNENDDWDSATVTPVAASVGAFGLAAGSKDSALVVTLQPGSYTVQVSGVGGGTGVALVEVYDTP